MTARTHIKTLRWLPAAALVTFAAAAATPAQTPAPATSWLGWYGCWSPASMDPTPSNAPAVCVTPAPSVGQHAVTFHTVVDGSVTGRTTLNVNGQRETSDREGCVGWEVASWSRTGNQVFVRSQHTCEGGLERNATAIIALSGPTWLDVRRVATTGTPGLMRAVRYEPLPSSRIPAEVLAELPVDRAMSISTARIAASGAVTVDDVIEASAQVDAPVVQAWLSERGQRFDLNARELMKLSSAKVAGGVVDVMMATTYPQVFALDRRAPETQVQPGAAAAADDLAVLRDMYGNRYLDFGYYDMLAYNRAMFMYGSSRHSGYYTGSRPVYIYVRGSDADPTVARAKVIKDAGYSQPRTTSSSGSSGATAPRLSGSSSSSGSSGASTSSGSSGSSSSGQTRTAKPRPPGGE